MWSLSDDFSVALPEMWRIGAVAFSWLDFLACLWTLYYLMSERPWLRQQMRSAQAARGEMAKHNQRLSELLDREEMARLKAKNVEKQLSEMLFEESKSNLTLKCENEMMTLRLLCLEKESVTHKLEIESGLLAQRNLSLEMELAKLKKDNEVMVIESQVQELKQQLQNKDERLRKLLEAGNRNMRLPSQLSVATATNSAAENELYELQTHLRVAEAAIVGVVNENELLAVRVFPSARDAGLCLSSLCTNRLRPMVDNAIGDLIRRIIKLPNAELKYLPFAMLHSAPTPASLAASKSSEYSHVRLAWLGDRLMRAQLAVRLCSAGYSREELHKKCEAAACNRRLSKWAHARQISKYVIMQQGIIEDKILATTVEAIMAVVALECGMAAMGRLIDDVCKSPPALDF
jgi:dsRNA-specific ribonuclease